MFKWLRRGFWRLENKWRAKHGYMLYCPDCVATWNFTVYGLECPFCEARTGRKREGK